MIIDQQQNSSPKGFTRSRNNTPAAKVVVVTEAVAAVRKPRAHGPNDERLPAACRLQPAACRLLAAAAAELLCGSA